MAEIRPFHGVHYNPALVKDLAKVICPPYDIISPQLQQELYQRSEHNFVRVEWGRETPQDRDNDNKYTRAAATLKKWLEAHILEMDKAPAVYIDDHQFKHQGKVYHRRGINCLVKLEEWDKKIIRPHEGTLSRAKSDRLNVLWALRANTSPIMALYEDADKHISRLLTAETRGKPTLVAENMGGESHRVWAIEDGKAVHQIHDMLARQPLYIADGHHRYESALAYARERRQYLKSAAESQPFDYVMMTLIDFTDPGLVILPAHRLIRGMAHPVMESLSAGLKSLFTIEEVTHEQVATREKLYSLLDEKEGEVKLLMYGPGKDRFLLLKLNDFTLVKSMIPYFHSELYQRLDVSIVDHVILEELLGLTHEAAGSYLDYENDAMEAIRRVREQEYQMAVIVNPVKPGVIKAIADNGDRMPRKSTYFYPKVPAGLVVYKFE